MPFVFLFCWILFTIAMFGCLLCQNFFGLFVFDCSRLCRAACQGLSHFPAGGLSAHLGRRRLSAGFSLASQQRGSRVDGKSDCRANRVRKDLACVVFCLWSISAGGFFFFWILLEGGSREQESIEIKKKKHQVELNSTSQGRSPALNLA
jgi:hypothetical protein